MFKCVVWDRQHQSGKELNGGRGYRVGGGPAWNPLKTKITIQAGNNQFNLGAGVVPFILPANGLQFVVDFLFQLSDIVGVAVIRANDFHAL